MKVDEEEREGERGEGEVRNETCIYNMTDVEFRWRVNGSSGECDLIAFPWLEK